MKITHTTTRPFQLALRNPITVGGVTQTHRDGLLLFLCDDLGNVGCGEISPLPGLHQQGEGDWKQALQHLLPGLEGLVCGDTFAETKQAWQALQRSLSPSPTLTFGVEMALANLWSARNQTPWHQLASKSAADSTAVQGLLWGNADMVLAQLALQSEAGYTTFKWKVARDTVPTERAVYKAICAALPPSGRLRLDANRGWELEDACAFVAGMDLAQIDFIEEPLKDTRQLPAFVERTGCPIALDETLHEWTHGVPPTEEDEAAYPHLRCAKAIVVKPQVLGGWLATEGWQSWASERGSQCVWSSAFESGLGLAYLAQWSAAAAPGEVAGLDTQSWFEKDLLPTLARQGSIALLDAQMHVHKYTQQAEKGFSHE